MEATKDEQYRAYKNPMTDDMIRVARELWKDEKPQFDTEKYLKRKDSAYKDKETGIHEGEELVMNRCIHALMCFEHMSESMEAVLTDDIFQNEKEFWMAVGFFRGVKSERKVSAACGCMAVDDMMSKLFEKDKED